MNQLYFGDNLTVLRGTMDDRSVDLVYLDPPFNSHEVHGTPKDLEGARNLAFRDKHQFQLWAGSRVNAVPFKGGKKGADSGIDGFIYFKPEEKLPRRRLYP